MRWSEQLRLVLLAVIALTLIAGLTVFYQTFNRILANERELNDRLAAVEKKLAGSSITSGNAGTAVSDAAGIPQTESGPFANRRFFDPAAEPGGRLMAAVASDTPNLNAILSNEAMAAAFNGLCNAALAERDYADPTRFEPVLAEKWTISPDRKRYHVTLRSGLFWQDVTDPVTGQHYKDVPVTSRDFAFFAEVVKNPAVNCAALSVYYADLERLEVLSDREFVVHWKSAWFGSLAATLGMAPLARHFYCPGGAPFDAAKFNGDHRRNRCIVGCGAYELAGWEKDRRITFRRSPRYIGKRFGAAPALETLTYDVIKLPNTRYQALLAGTLDQLSLTPDQWTTRTKEPAFQKGELRKFSYQGSSYTYLGWNGKNPLFADARVRTALTLLTDRERICREIYHGLAAIVSSPMMPGTPYCDPALRPLPCDPARAKKLLAEAGWRDADGDGILEKEGRKFSFTMLQIASSSIQSRLMPLLREAYAAAGIEMRTQIVEWSVYLQRLNARSYDACCLGWTTSPDPDPYQVWHSSQADRPESSNHVSFRNAEADRLIEQLRVTFDPAERVKLARAFALILHREQPYTFLVSPYALTAQSGRYRNVRKFPLGIPDALFWTPRAEQRAVPSL